MSPVVTVLTVDKGIENFEVEGESQGEEEPFLP